MFVTDKYRIFKFVCVMCVIYLTGHNFRRIIFSLAKIFVGYNFRCNFTEISSNEYFYPTNNFSQYSGTIKLQNNENNGILCMCCHEWFLQLELLFYECERIKNLLTFNFILNWYDTVVLPLVWLNFVTDIIEFFIFSDPKCS